MNPGVDGSSEITLEKDDVVRQVRECGTEHIISLETEQSIDLGSGVRMERADGEWSVKAAPHCILLENGVERREFVLRPATQIGVGSFSYIAESKALIALRNVCRRLLGWGTDEQLEADRAVRRIWLSVTHRTAIVLRGGGDLVAAARAIHRVVRGGTAPFVACSFREYASLSIGDSISRQIPVNDVLEYAKGGSLCLRKNPKANEFSKHSSALWSPSHHIQLFICSQDRMWPYSTLSGIHIPRLGQRIADLPRIVDEYARDSVEQRGLPLDSFGEKERRFVLRYHATTLTEIEMAVDRILELVAAPNFHDAARRLQLDADWIRRLARVRRSQ